ncbi:MAG: D-glycerate dehydrogenase [Maricaulaceae bacterium]|jgi:glyoxylate reductase
MVESRPRVVVTRRLPAPVEARMADLFDVRINETDAPLAYAELAALAKDADVLVPTLGDKIDAALIEAASSRLKLIANFGAGVDHIDVAAAQARGIVVTNTPGVLTEDTADMTTALILVMPRRLTESVRALQRGEFPGWSPTWMLGRRISGSNLGIVGMGRIGQAVARRARAFGMSIHYHNRRPVSHAIAESLEATYHENLSDMLAISDVVSVNCPKTPATYHLLSRRRMEHLQPHAYIVNTSRGDVIDEEALADMLEDGRIAGAALDVFEHATSPNPRLLKRDNVLLVPHMSSATLESRVEMGESVIINIRIWQSGDRPPDRILPEEVGVEA